VRHARRGHGRIFWRVYLTGVLLLVLVALALGVVGWLYGGGGPGPRPERFVEYAAERVAGTIGDPARLSAELAGVRETFGADVSVWRDGKALASNVTPPLGPLDDPDRGRVAAGAFRVTGRRWLFAAPVPGTPGAHVLLGGAWRPHAFSRAAVALLAVLAALAVGSIPLARAIAAPLERLTRAARALGAGDLRARAGFRGRGEVGELAAAFDEMAARLEALVRGERELLANVSHELRTPLARMRVALDLAAEGDLEASRRWVAEIGTDLADLEALVGDVLTAARLDLAAGGAGGGLPLRRERVDPRDLLDRVAQRFRAVHPSRPLEVRLEGALPVLDADPAMLRRVVDNLLDNARKYSDEGAPVTLAARDAGGLEVEVRDRGIGIDAADLPRLFTPFFRTDRSRARGTGGGGLGLALARRIVESHGGRIVAESEVGQGTVIRFRIPSATQVASSASRSRGVP